MGLEKILPVAKEVIKALDFWFAPSSFIRYIYKLNKNINPKSDTIVAEYITAIAGESIRLGAYAALTIEAIQKYL